MIDFRIQLGIWNFFKNQIKNNDKYSLINSFYEVKYDY